MLRRFIAATLLAALAVVPFTHTAIAGGPTIVKSPISFEASGLACNGVTYDIALSGKVVVQDFGDRTLVHTTISGEIVASDGTRIRVHHSWSEAYDWVAMTLTISGIPFGERVEMSSVRIQDRGRLVIDLLSGTPSFVAGKFSPGPPDPHAATCELIALAA